MCMWLLFLTQEEFRPAHLRKVVAQLEPVRGEKRRIQELQEHESVSHDTSSVCVCVCVVGVCRCVCACVSLLYVHIYYLMGEKVIWLDIARVCVRIFTSHR